MHPEPLAQLPSKDPLEKIKSGVPALCPSHWAILENSPHQKNKKFRNAHGKSKKAPVKQNILWEAGENNYSPNL